MNLGIKVPSEQLIQAVREHRPDVIGLSGLLVKSAQQMVLTAGDLAAVGHRHAAPGRRRGAHPPLHAPQDRAGLHGASAPTPRTPCTASRWSSGCPIRTGAAGARGGDRVDRRQRQRRTPEATKPADAADDRAAPLDGAARRAGAAAAATSTATSSSSTSTRSGRDLNPQMLYGKHLGLQGRRCAGCAEEGDAKYLKLEAVVDELKALARGGAMHARAVWRFFPARAEGERLTLARSRTPAGSRPSGRSRARPGRRASASPTSSSTATTSRSSSPRPAPACASGWRRGSTKAST